MSCYFNTHRNFTSIFPSSYAFITRPIHNIFFPSHSAVELDVTITITPSDSDFRASSPLMLACEAKLGTGNYTYQWSSNCTGNCLIGNQTTVSLQRDALRSTDSGLHTCTVMDDAGNAGVGTLLIHVTGTVLFYVDVQSCINKQSIYIVILQAYVLT